MQVRKLAIGFLCVAATVVVIGAPSFRPWDPPRASESSMLTRTQDCISPAVLPAGSNLAELIIPTLTGLLTSPHLGIKWLADSDCGPFLPDPSVARHAPVRVSAKPLHREKKPPVKIEFPITDPKPGKITIVVLPQSDGSSVIRVKVVGVLLIDIDLGFLLEKMPDGSFKISRGFPFKTDITLTLQPDGSIRIKGVVLQRPGSEPEFLEIDESMTLSVRNGHFCVQVRDFSDPICSPCSELSQQERDVLGLIPPGLAPAGLAECLNTPPATPTAVPSPTGAVPTAAPTAAPTVAPTVAWTGSGSSKPKQLLQNPTNLSAPTF